MVGGVRFIAHSRHKPGRSAKSVGVRTTPTSWAFSSVRFVIVRSGGFRDAEVAGSNPAFPTRPAGLRPPDLGCLVWWPGPILAGFGLRPTASGGEQSTPESTHGLMPTKVSEQTLLP